MFKLNSFVDRPLINLLYEASQQGVRVLLNIRGICCLRPGVEGLSENIRVISIVDHFLEHGRIFYFRNGGQEEVYLSSADLMPRNLDRRIELLFPIEDAGQKKRLRTVLEQTFRANRNAYELAPDGSYVPIQQEAGSEPLRVQEAFQRMAERAAQKRKGESQQAFKVRRKMSALEI
jgi:polyphosphate kinase